MEPMLPWVTELKTGCNSNRSINSIGAFSFTYDFHDTGLSLHVQRSTCIKADTYPLIVWILYMIFKLRQLSSLSSISKTSTSLLRTCKQLQ